jgi:hypothetical protein
MGIKNVSKWLVPLLAMLLISSYALSQSEMRNRTLAVTGFGGEARVIQMNGRSYVDLEMLAQVVNGSLAFQDGRIVLSLPNMAGSALAAVPANQHANPGFSREFASAAIEALGVMREWAGALAVLVKNSYPVTSGIDDYRGRAGQSVQLAAAAASTPSDRSALQTPGHRIP